MHWLGARFGGMRNRSRAEWGVGEGALASLSFSEDCRLKAAQSLRLAQKRSEPASKAMLLTMAEEWLKLAEDRDAEAAKPN